MSGHFAGHIRVRRAVLLNLEGQRVAIIGMVVADLIPQLVMFEGEPFLLSRRELAYDVYDQVQPFRADRRLMIEAAS